MFSGTGNVAGNRRIYQDANQLTRSGPVVRMAALVPARSINAQIQAQREQQSVQQQQRESLARAAAPGSG